MNRTYIYALAACSLLFAGMFGYNDYLDDNKVYFGIEMDSSANGTSEVFFDTGNGYIQQDSSKLPVSQRGIQKYYFPVNASIKSIRFDPIDKASRIRINKAEIGNKKGDTLKIFPIQSFKASQQISKIDIVDNALFLHTLENANDPIIEIENSSFHGESSWFKFLSQHVWKYVGLALFLFILIFSLTKCRFQRIGRVLAWLVNCATANPNITITIIGLIAAIASCYPVVFFGKSFISPVGVSALYSNPPWIPGLSFNGVVENFRGSDLGATLWQIAPHAVVQHESIFKHFEFPFWNRYVDGGIPLFAQGQSMIGDVLHWIPVYLDGSSIGWDIKFVLSKAIFAIGMGLLVFRLTNKVLAGFLITISSCFIGFFAFRFNHPAFFVLTYAPWVILAWNRLGYLLASPSTPASSCIFQALMLALFTWLQLNSGAPKEGVITAFFIHALGTIIFWNHISFKLGRLRSLFFIGGLGLSLVMIAAPYWLIFLDFLGKASTAYDVPSISTFRPDMLIGFFDNYYFQKYFNDLKGPSVNLFILLGMSSSLYCLRFRQSNMVYGTWLLFMAAMSTAYGLIPDQILLAIPLVNNIIHVGDTFSMPMVVIALLIAGFGIRDYIDASEMVKRKILIFSLISFLVLLFAISMTYIKLFISVTLFVVGIGFIQLFSLSKTNNWTHLKFLVLLSCFLLLHVRHGMHLQTGNTYIDDHVINPTQRGNYSTKSDAIEFLKKEMASKKIVTRVIGEGETLFPGFNERLGLEGLVAVDAVRSKYYSNLLSLLDYPLVAWGWLRQIKSEQITNHAAALDFLDVGYMVAMPGTKIPLDMKLIHSSDLEIWTRETVWPRAFFVNKPIEIHQASEILKALKDKLHTPFAAVENQYIPHVSQNINIPYRVLPATQYKLTNNSTQFSVEASGPGIIVLSETYYPADFVAKLNGVEVDYIRVNEASKGIWVNKAGKYDVSFTYKPEKLNQSLALLVLGLVLLFLLIISMIFKSPFRVNLHTHSK